MDGRDPRPGLAQFASVPSLAQALRAELARAGSPYRAASGETAVNSWRTADLADGERRARVFVDHRAPRFMIVLKDARTDAAQGVTADLASVADVVHRWLSGASGSQIAAVSPVLGSVALHRARERGDTVEYQWRRIVENPARQPHWLLLHPFVTLAFQEPRLRALLPWTAMWTLCFSDSARHRLPPTVEPLRQETDLFVVRTDRDEIGRAGAAGCLELVLSAL